MYIRPTVLLEFYVSYSCTETTAQAVESPCRAYVLGVEIDPEHKYRLLSNTQNLLQLVALAKKSQNRLKVSQTIALSNSNSTLPMSRLHKPNERIGMYTGEKMSRVHVTQPGDATGQYVLCPNNTTYRCPQDQQLSRIHILQVAVVVFDVFSSE